MVTLHKIRMTTIEVDAWKLMLVRFQFFLKSLGLSLGILMKRKSFWFQVS
jgi:hypothetical protein